MASARGTVWLTICIEEPSTIFLNFTREKSGSIPVVSQSIMKPMVPVGASTEAWALRKPFSAPSSTTLSHSALAAASTVVSLVCIGCTFAVASRCLRITAWWGSALAA